MDTHLLLNEIFDHYQDVDWVSRNASDLYTTINATLNDENTASQARDALLLVYPRALIHGDVKKWGKMIHDALAVSLKQVSKSIPEEGYKTINDLYMTSGQSKSPETAIAKPVRRATRRQNPRAILDSYIGIFKLQVYQQTSSFTEKAVAGALDLARLVNHPQLYARLYQALAYAYIFWGEYDRAIDRGQQAYAHWTNHGNAEEAGLTAYVIAIAHRWLGQYDEAITWLQMSSLHFSDSAYTQYKMIVEAEMGAVHLLQFQFAEAEACYQAALYEAQNLKDDYTSALLLHSTSIAQMYQEKLADAAQSLGKAYEYWQANPDPRQLSHIHHTFAYLRGLQNEREQALDHLRQAAEFSSQLPENEFRTFLETHIHTLRGYVEAGVDLHTVPPG